MLPLAHALPHSYRSFDIARRSWHPCFVYFRSISHFLATFMAKRFHEAYGVEATERGWDNPDSMLNKYYYRAAVAFIGGVLLLISIRVLLS